MMLRGVGGIYTGMREEFQDWEERKGKRGAGRGGARGSSPRAPILNI